MPKVNTEEKFFEALEKLIEENGIMIERQKGTPHPRFPDFIYAVDYGYIKSTTSQDGNGIDIFVGTSNNGVVGCLCTVDLLKKDSEIKVLYNCNQEEIDKAVKMMSNAPMSCLVFLRNSA